MVYADGYKCLVQSSVERIGLIHFSNPLLHTPMFGNIPVSDCHKFAIEVLIKGSYVKIFSVQ